MMNAKKWRFLVVRAVAVSMTARMLGQSDPKRMDPSCMMIWGKAAWISIGRTQQSGASVVANTFACDDSANLADGMVSMKTSLDTVDNAWAARTCSRIFL
jgi:hypothetical protein